MTNVGRAGSVVGQLESAAELLPWLLRRTNQRYRAAIRDRLVANGFGELPQPGFWALRIISRGRTDAGQLIAEMGISKQAVSKLVENLVTSGFIERRVNESDRRRTDLVLTAKGRRAAKAIGQAVRATGEIFVAELGADRFTDLVQTMALIAEERAR
jgi:DNA-binding MarR family transcriptional regulator